MSTGTQPKGRQLRWRSCAVIVATSVLAFNAVSAVNAGADSGSAQAASTVLTPSSPLQLCGVADLAAVTAPSQPSPDAHVVTGVTPAMSVSTFVVAGGLIYVMNGLTTIRTFSLIGTPVSVFTLPVAVRHAAIAVAPDGSMFIAGYPDRLVRLSANGQVAWSRQVAGAEISSLFAWSSPAGFRVGVVTRNPGSALFDLAGNPVGSSQVTGQIFTATADGGLLATDGRYVRRYDAALNPGGVFGAAGIANDPQPQGGPFHFYQQGGAVAAGSRVYVADATRGIEAATRTGSTKGSQPRRRSATSHRRRRCNLRGTECSSPMAGDSTRHKESRRFASRISTL